METDRSSRFQIQKQLAPPLAAGSFADLTASPASRPAQGHFNNSSALDPSAIISGMDKKNARSRARHPELLTPRPAPTAADVTRHDARQLANATSRAGDDQPALHNIDQESRCERRPPVERACHCFSTTNFTSDGSSGPPLDAGAARFYPCQDMDNPRTFAVRGQRRRTPPSTFVSFQQRTNTWLILRGINMAKLRSALPAKHGGSSQMLTTEGRLFAGVSIECTPTTSACRLQWTASAKHRHHVSSLTAQSTASTNTGVLRRSSPVLPYYLCLHPLALSQTELDSSSSPCLPQSCQLLA
jgi:hypothetical protein